MSPARGDTAVRPAQYDLIAHFRRTGARARGENGQVRRERLPSSVERRLVLAARRGGEEARAHLVEAVPPLIASVARIYRNSRAVERLELMQEGVVGLLRALDRYDPRRGTPFWAYASW